VNNRLCLLFFILVSPFLLKGQQFLYPIDQLDDENVLLMHQISSDDIELLVWNKNTKLALRELTSLYLPAHVQLLPSKQAYGFLDRGRIRVKAFTKRTPKTIDISQPICDIQSMRWITDEQFYFVAKFRGYYKVFLYDIADQGGVLYALTNLDDDANYTFPCKVGDRLFYLAQTSDGLFQFVSNKWKPHPYEGNRNTIQNKGLLGCCFDLQAQTITHDNPLCFLHMLDEQHGFVIEMFEKKSYQTLFQFGCCAINLENNKCTIERLFEFTLPENLMVGQGANRLYESIYPLLPRYYKSAIYFTTYDPECGQCYIAHYNLENHIQSRCTATRSASIAYQHLFAPLILDNNQILAGCAYHTGGHYRSALHINEINGVVDCDIPIIKDFYDEKH